MVCCEQTVVACVLSMCRGWSSRGVMSSLALCCVFLAALRAWKSKEGRGVRANKRVKGVRVSKNILNLGTGVSWHGAIIQRVQHRVRSHSQGARIGTRSVST